MRSLDGIWKLTELLNIGYIAWNALSLCLNDLKLVNEYVNDDIGSNVRYWIES